MPEGLEDVSKYPNLIAELIRRDWTEVEVKAAMGNNLLRVLRRAEQVFFPFWSPDSTLFITLTLTKLKLYNRRQSPIT